MASKPPLPATAEARRFPATGVAGNRGADFVQCLAPSRGARRNLALDPTALLGASGYKHPASPAMLAGQRRD
jgi:hypothetical protein